MIKDFGGKTPKELLKLGLIPALILVLVAVVFWPSGESSSSIEPIGLAPTTAIKPANKDVKTAAPKWPQVSLQELIAFNPFEPYEPTDDQPEYVRVESTQSLGLFHSFLSADAIEAFKTKWWPGSGEQDAAKKIKSAKNDKPPHYASIGTLKAVYFDARGAAAILDSEVVRVGDTVPGGRRIVEITEQGIKLEEVD